MSALPDKVNSSTSLSPSTSYIGCALSLLIILFFYGWHKVFVEGLCSAFIWLRSTWNPENDYEHGWMIPFIAAYMFAHAWRSMKSIPQKPSLYGLTALAAGALMYLLSVRTMQGRIAIAGLPFILCGLVWCYRGGRAAWHCAFPCFFLWLAIPLPGLQQATVGLQLLASQAAHTLAGWCGVATVLEGTNISSSTGNWDAFDIAGGCSGMRSLMALIMLSTAWGYLAERLSLWKRCVLAVSAIPLSIVANAFRVASIFVCAEYINPTFAGKTWHDWSGLLFFFPASLIGLTLIHALLAGELPFFSQRRAVTRHQAHSRQNPHIPATAEAAPASPGKSQAAPCQPHASPRSSTPLRHHLLPPIFLGLTMSLIWLIPHEEKLRDSAISPDLPLGTNLPGWYGIRTQESEIERKVLAGDTKFSKGLYQSINRISDTPQGPPISVSIVYSGSDMNSSIHRPERCLPAQGHRNLHATSTEIKLQNGSALPITRLDSTTTREEEGQETRYHHVHYYLFIGSDYICASHYDRTLRDICDQVVRGYTQRWAYLQIGAACREDDAEALQQTDQLIQELIRRLLPRLINQRLLER